MEFRDQWGVGGGSIGDFSENSRYQYIERQDMNAASTRRRMGGGGGFNGGVFGGGMMAGPRERRLGESGERSAGQSYVVTPALDMWSVGCILYM